MTILYSNSLHSWKFCNCSIFKFTAKLIFVLPSNIQIHCILHIKQLGSRLWFVFTADMENDVYGGEVQSTRDRHPQKSSSSKHKHKDKHHKSSSSSHKSPHKSSSSSSHKSPHKSSSHKSSSHKSPHKSSSHKSSSHHKSPHKSPKKRKHSGGGDDRHDKKRRRWVGRLGLAV